MNDPISATASAALAHTLSPVELFLQADSIVKTVIVLLLLASAWGWTVIAEKLVRLAILQSRASKLFESVKAGLPVTDIAESFAKTSANDPLLQIYQAMVDEQARSADLIYTEGQRDSLQDRVHRVAVLASSSAIDHLQARLPGLATIGAVSPFVGLFGTVWGIMSSFQSIAASKNTSLAVVAPGIAEALFATAIGLIAAIPATIFYNKFTSEVNRQAQRLEGFADEFSAILSRQIDERA